MRRQVATALVAALVLVLAGCGAGERTEVVSKAQAVRRLENACLVAAKESKQLKGRFERTEYLETIRLDMQRVEDRVAHLETTGRAKMNFDAYKTALQTRIDAITRILSTDRSDLQRIRPVVGRTIDDANRRAHAAIVRLGAKHVCP